MAITPKCHVHSIQKVGTDHGYLINDQKVQGTDYLLPFLAEAPVALRHLIFRHKFLDIRKIWT